MVEQEHHDEDKCLEGSESKEELECKNCHPAFGTPNAIRRKTSWSKSVSVGTACNITPNGNYAVNKRKAEDAMPYCGGQTKIGDPRSGLQNL